MALAASAGGAGDAAERERGLTGARLGIGVTAVASLELVAGFLGLLGAEPAWARRGEAGASLGLGVVLDCGLVSGFDVAGLSSAVFLRALLSGRDLLSGAPEVSFAVSFPGSDPAGGGGGFGAAFPGAASA